MEHAQPHHRNDDELLQTIITNSRVKLRVAMVCVCLVTCGASSVPAQTPPPITPTSGTGDLGTTVIQVGNTSQITGGTRPSNGPNLFHSFG